MEKKEFIVQMTKDEMIKFYANKIVEDGIKNCYKFRNAIKITDYNNENLKLQEYTIDILNSIYKDERVSEAFIFEDGYLSMVFNSEFCPFYYDNIWESPMYRSSTQSIKAIILRDFVNYLRRCIDKETFISTVKLIKDFTNQKLINEKEKWLLFNFLKKSIIKTGFVNKYLDNINVYVTHKNRKELEKGLLKIVDQLDKISKKAIETDEEFE